MSDSFWRTLAVAALAMLAWREFSSPPRAAADTAPPFYVEPGTVDIPLAGGGNAQGKVFIDLTTGDAFGFPAFAPKLPYPGAQVSESRPLIVAPVYLGRFDLSKARRGVAPRPYN
jgi:hypothetical protein